jgi:superfamily II DNA or RNA helicase
VSEVQLSEALLAKLAGWEAMKHARGLVAAGCVGESQWQFPLLRGKVREGAANYAAGLIIKSESDAENLCTCRTSRQRGTICAHSVAVGLNFLRQQAPPADPLKTGGMARREPRPPEEAPLSDSPKPKALQIPPAKTGAKALRRAVPGEMGEPLELFIVLPPNFAEALAKQRVMLYAEGKWRKGRAPLNALPLDIEFQLDPQDAALLDVLDKAGGGDTPAALLLDTGHLAQIFPLLAGHPRVTLGRTQRLDFVLEPATPAFELHLEGGLAVLDAKLECLYDGKPVSLAGPQAFWLPDPQSPARLRARNVEAERAAVARLVRHGFAGPGAGQMFHLDGENTVLNFFAREYPRLQREWRVTLGQRLERSAQKLERVEARCQVTSSGQHWFDLDLAYQTPGGSQFAPADIQRLLLSGQSHTRLRNGNIALLDTEAIEEFQEVLRDCAPQQHARGYRIDNTQAGFVEATLRQQTGWQVQAPAQWKERAAQQRGQAPLQPPPLGELETVLRPYQKQGVAWLHFLRANGFGGILADEMGLGKTVQVLAHLSALKTRARPQTPGDAGTPTLVVCPTSLVFNWMAEAAKFTPNLRALALHGPQRRELFPQIADADLVITSYALLRRDAEHYRQVPFDTVVLDEAQHIKNRQTQNAQSVKSVRSRHRLVLTGTPLENSVLDLWSIFDFLMPGYLGAAADFRERYELPIVQGNNPAAQARLARRLRPFLLRRLKREVAPELPDKIEQTSFCELNEDQRALYRQILETSRHEILQAVGAQGLAKSRMLILTTLLRLRQICCDLRLLKLPSGEAQRLGAQGGLTQGAQGTQRTEGTQGTQGTQSLDEAQTQAQVGPSSSGKMEMFRELLEEVLDGGHRVLVFSQFTSMLALIREELTAQNIGFCYLDGATPDRSQVVEKFQRDARVPVFLISLKAGGVGLNLTGADTVIHFDPWWNPAVEAQATDRAHRIGQQKVVTSYKLITRGTVEEKILQLQNRKRTLLQAALGGEEELAQALTWDEIQELLA